MCDGCNFGLLALRPAAPSRRSFLGMGGAWALGTLGMIASSRPAAAAPGAALLSSDTAAPAVHLSGELGQDPTRLVDPHTRGAQAQVTAVLIRDVRIFDGRADRLSERMSVLVSGNHIAGVGPTLPTPSGATVVDGGGRVLMPGLIDAHWHAFMGPNTLNDLLAADEGYLHTVAAAEATATLLRGFTTIRDAAGPVFGLKRAIDEGRLPGPRVYPSGAMISQTSGHGDFRTRPERPRRFGGQLSRGELLGAVLLADGAAEVTTAVREQLRLGASQIKLAAGGGVASEYDPLDSLQYTFEELQAAVRAASDWGTYVMVHIYTAEGVRRAVEAGVRSIEHGHLLDEPTVKLLADTGTWLSMQPFVPGPGDAQLPPARLEKFQQLYSGTERVYSLARHYGVKMAFGTDKLFSPVATASQNSDFGSLGRWFTPVEVLRMATGTNGELLTLSGPRNPYAHGTLGVVEERAYADLLIVEGNPLEDIRLLERPAENLALIMKDGKIYKNTLL
jgi:imidazolonepropionase-like amidohydrolase